MGTVDLPPICALVWGMLMVQPFYMWLCGRFPRAMSSLMVNPSALPFSAQYGHAALNFQSVGLLVYHTNTTDRVIHVVTFFCDSTAQVALAVCGWGPTLIPPLRWLLQSCAELVGSSSLQEAVMDVSDSTLGWTLVLLGLTTVVWQANSLGGPRLAVAVAAAWSLVAGIHMFGYWLFLSDLPGTWGSDVAHRGACALLLGGTALRVFGHMSEIQHVHIIGCHSFLAKYNPVLDAKSWRAQPLRALAHNCIFVVRSLIITGAALLTEFNAGMPFRLFPVLVHLVQMRATDLWHARHAESSPEHTASEAVAEIKPNFIKPTPSSSVTSVAEQKAALAAAAAALKALQSSSAMAFPPQLMDVEELNAAASYILAHGWCAYTSDMAVRLRLAHLLGIISRDGSDSSCSPSSSISPPVAALKGADVAAGHSLVHDPHSVCTCGSSGPSPPAPLYASSSSASSSASSSPALTRPRTLSAATARFLHLPQSALPPATSLKWKSRVFEGIDVLKEFRYNSDSVFMYQTKRRCIVPMEREGWCCWGLWPEPLQLPTATPGDRPDRACSPDITQAAGDLISNLGSCVS